MDKPMAAAIQLDETCFIGKGGTRTCYRHPHASDRCIKIDRCGDRGPTAKEALYYQKLGRTRPDLDYILIPRFHGFVDTNLGRGGVFDLVRDPVDGKVSKTLSFYIKSGQVSENDARWVEAHRKFLKSLVEDAVCLKDFHAGNVCVRRMLDGTFEFVAIDGIGHRDFIPLCDYSRWFARCKLQRKIKRMRFGSLAQILDRVAEKSACANSC